MAILDTTKKPYVADRDELVFIGMDYPFHKSNGVEGWFASTDTTIKAVKNNIKMLLMTEKGERFLQPNMGMNFRRFLFEQFTDDTRIAIENEIVDTFSFWLPFVEIRDIEIFMGDDDAVGKNRLSIKILFNIKRDPNTLDSVQVSVGE